MSVVMSMLAELGEVACAGGGARLLGGEIGEARLAQLAATYDKRQTHDRAKLDAMIAYAQSALCRWHLILRAFGRADRGRCLW